MLRSIGKQSWESVESFLKKKRRLWWEGLQKRKVLSLEWKNERVLDDESGESKEPVGELPLIGLGESELEKFVHG